MGDHQEGDATDVETTMQGLPAEPKNGEPIHVMTPPVTINNDKRLEPNILDTLDNE